MSGDVNGIAGGMDTTRMSAAEQDRAYRQERQAAALRYLTRRGLADVAVILGLTPERLGPNAVLPCGTDSARRRHYAHGEDCTPCGTDGLAPPVLPPPLICQGRAWTPDGWAVGDVCGEQHPARYRYGASLDDTRPETTAEQAARAVAAGWLVDPIPACPACRRPARGPIDIAQYQTGRT